MVRELGEELSRRREDLGLTLDQAQGATKIRLRYLQALESGDFSLIPGEVFVKGFLRAYGDYLGLDGAALVQRYKSEQPAGGADGAEAGFAPPTRSGDPVPRPREVRRRAGRPRGRARRWPAVLGRAAVLIGLLSIIYYLSGYRSDTEEPGWTGPGPAAPGDAAVVAPPAPATPPATPPAGTRAAEPEPVVEIEKVVAGRRVTFSVGNVAGLKVKASFSGSCWVRVTADGRYVFEGTLQAGHVQEWLADREIRIRAGLPANMRIEINGSASESFPSNEPIDLVIERQV